MRERVRLRLDSGEVLAEGTWRDAMAAEAAAMDAARGITRQVLADGTAVTREHGVPVLVVAPGVRLTWGDDA